MKSIIVYGPQGCGKTVNAAPIAEHFGLTCIVDGGYNTHMHNATLDPKSEGVLYLTNEKPTDAVAARVTVLDYAPLAHMLSLTTPV